MATLEQKVRRALDEATCLHGVLEMRVSLEEGDYQIIVIPKDEETGEVSPEALDHLIASMDRPWKRSFLSWIRKGKTVEAAAQLSAVSRRHVNRMYHKDPRFGRTWDILRITRSTEAFCRR